MDKPNVYGIDYLNAETDQLLKILEPSRLETAINGYTACPANAWRNQVSLVSTITSCLRGLVFNFRRGTLDRVSGPLVAALKKHVGYVGAGLIHFVDQPTITETILHRTVTSGMLFELDLPGGASVFWHPDASFRPNKARKSIVVPAPCRAA